MAFSGGRDSTALLHATVFQAQALGIRVLALHVHHGLSPHADSWLAHCEGQCRHWRAQGATLDFQAQRLGTRPAPGESIEAWARDARYAALRTLASTHGASVVLLGQHRRDQAETWLLQALRGAGAAGISGMPHGTVRDGIRWLRPWLNSSRAEVDDYVRRHALDYIEDDSNSDVRFARNRLRLQVWPSLMAAFPDAEAALARAAEWAQQANAALSELAEIDLSAAAPGSKRLLLELWMNLSPARRSISLRTWLTRQTGRPASASLTLRLLDELPQARGGRWSTDGGELRLYRGVLRFYPAQSAGAGAPPRETGLSIRRAGCRSLPGWGGRLRIRRVPEGGVPLAWLAHLELKARRGGERFQSGIDRPARSLKKQFQAAAVAAWDRDGPLVYSGGQLVYVPGLGLDARVIGLPGQVLVMLNWEPSDAVGTPGIDS